MDNQPASPASTPVTPAGTAYVPPTQPNQTPPTPPPTMPPQNPTPVQTSQAKPRSKMMLIIGTLVVLILLAGGGYYVMTMQQQPKPTPMVKKMKPIPTLIPTITPMATDSATASDSADWKTFTNATHNLSLKYPSNYIVTETDYNVLFTEKPINLNMPAPEDNISITYKGADYAKEFTALFTATKGTDVKEAQHAVDVKIEKLNNLKVGSFDAVEYTRDGTVLSSGLGRGPIGYSQNYMIKVSPTEYIQFSNTAMTPEVTKARSTIFSQMFSTLSFTK